MMEHLIQGNLDYALYMTVSQNVCFL